MKDFNGIKKACFSGYRPQKFDFKLNKHDDSYKILITRLEETLRSLVDEGCEVFYCGMAQGFDMIAAECVVSLKKKFKNLRIVCVIPYLGHESSINDTWRKRYDKIINSSDEVVYTSYEYSSYCFQTRNRYMVDASDCVVCWYDGKTGGTQNTIKYAQKTSKYIINLNVEYGEELNFSQNMMDL